MTLTRTRLAAIAVVSIFATAVVLSDGARSAPSRAYLAAAVKRVIAERSAAAATPPATTPTPQPRAPVSAPVSDPVTPAVASSAPPASTADTGTTTHEDTTTTPAPAPKPKASKVGHVFVIALTGTGYQQTFGAQSPMPYLATDLRPRGALLSGFHPVDAADLPNYLAFAGGLAPTAETRTECATYSDDGCVQANTVLSLGDQISSSGRLWRAYSEDMGDQPCRHPQNGTADDTLHGGVGGAGSGYATRHNPFVYFHSLVDLGDCQANDVALDALPTDLKTEKTTPNLAFIAPNLCNSGTESACADGSPGGPAAVDAFLKTWVPQVLESPAYKKDGALFVAFLSGPSGTDPTGALLLSRFARRGSLYAKPYDPYALLRTIEDLFALKALAKAKKAPSFAKVTLTTAFPPS